MTLYETEARSVLHDWSSAGTLRAKYGFAIWSDEAVAALKNFGPILEVGSGNGYAAFELRKAGLEVFPTDFYPPAKGANTYGFVHDAWVDDVEKLSASKAVKTYGDRARTLLLCWPCYNRGWAYRTLCLWRGEFVVYVGEGMGGCTADDRFHAKLDRDWEQIRVVDIPQWHGIHDFLAIYRRRNSLDKRLGE